MGIEQKLKKHLLETVGKKPTKKEMSEIDREISEIFKKVYDKPDKKEGIIREVYNKRLAKLWDKVVATETFPSEIRLLSKYAKIRSNFNIASIASGLGIYELFLAKEFAPKGKVYCLDISSEMSKRGRYFARKLNQRNIKFIVASAIKIPLKSNSQDLVLARRTGLSNDKKWIKVLSEANRIIKKNDEATFVFTVDKSFNKPINKIKEDLLSVNFRFIDMLEFNRRNGINGTVCMIVAKPI